MKTHRHLTYSDRCQIYALLKRGISRADITRDIGVHRSTISKELRRNLQPTGHYYHTAAQLLAEDRQERRDKRPWKMTPPLLAFIEARLLEDWSPQQISGWLRYRQRELPTLSHERIYQHVWRDKWDGGTLHKHLRHRGRRYWRRGSAYERRGRIPDRVDIDLRPAIVEQKSRVGVWELDTIVGPVKRPGALVSMVDRCSKLVRLSLVPARRSAVLTQAIEARLQLFVDMLFGLTQSKIEVWRKHFDERDGPLSTSIT